MKWTLFCLVFLFSNNSKALNFSELVALLDNPLTLPGSPTCPESAANHCVSEQEKIRELQARRNEVNKQYESNKTQAEVELKKISKEIQSTYALCREKNFKSCFPQLKNKMETAKLNTSFNEWKKNSFYRMKTPEVHCYNRAVLLSLELAQNGYQTELIQIDSPVLLAMNKNRNDEWDKNYFNYPRSHWVVTIKDSNSKELALDPQFMNSPIPLETYFKQISGQNCAEGSTQVLACTFKRFSGGYRPYTGEKSFLEMGGSSCFSEEIEREKKTITEVNTWNFTSGLPSSSTRSEEQVRKELLQLHYQEYFKSLESRINQNTDPEGFSVEEKQKALRAYPDFLSTLE